jgi:hypothetical protein
MRRASPDKVCVGRNISSDEAAGVRQRARLVSLAEQLRSRARHPRKDSLQALSRDDKPEDQRIFRQQGRAGARLGFLA